MKGELMTNISDINKVFVNFYNQLHKSEVKLGRNECDPFFSKIRLPEMLEDQKEWLDHPITVDEVKTAIVSMRAGKSPGWDGYPSRFIDKLTPILTQIYDKSFSVRKLPDTFNEALISLIGKNDKDPSDPASYSITSLS